MSEGNRSNPGVARRAKSICGEVVSVSDVFQGTKELAVKMKCCFSFYIEIKKNMRWRCINMLLQRGFLLLLERGSTVAL